VKRTYETCGKEFTSRKAADRYARNIANASGLRVPVYETTSYDDPADHCQPNGDPCQCAACYAKREANRATV
jgi:hypothetical protein